jgi:hypothetical protein
VAISTPDGPLAPDAPTAAADWLPRLAHALNNPLAVILSEAILLEEEAEGTPFADGAARMRRAAESCSAILSAVATLVMRPEPERSPLDLAELARDLHDGAALAPLPSGATAASSRRPSPGSSTTPARPGRR